MEYVKKSFIIFATQMRYKCNINAFEMRLNSVYIAYKVHLVSNTGSVKEGKNGC